MEVVNAQEAGFEAAKEARNETLRELENRGITWDLLTRKLKAELNARKVEVFKGWVKDLDEDGKVVSTHEEVIYSKGMVAWDIRQKARQDAHKLRGDYPAEKHEVGGKNGGPIRHEIDSGGALQTLIERLVGSALGPPTNGHTE